MTRPPAALRLFVQIVVAIGGRRGRAIRWRRCRAAPHPLEWARVCGSGDGRRIVHAQDRVDRGDDRSRPTRSSSTSALLFGPGPATVALALDGIVISWRRGHAVDAHRVQTPRPGPFDVGRRARLLPHRTDRRRSSQVDAAARHARPAAVLPDDHLFRAQFRSDRDRRRARIAAVARSTIWRQHFLWLSVGYLAAASLAFCLILMIQQVEPRSPWS